MLGNLLNKSRKKQVKEKPLTNIKGDLIEFLRGNQEKFIQDEFNSIHKPENETREEFYLGYKILALDLKEVFEESSSIILIPPKYEFWTYLFLSIKLVQLGYKVNLIYHSWARKIIAEFQEHANYLEYANLKFENIDEITIDLSVNPYVINFSDTFKGIRTTVPTFSTAYIHKTGDLDYAIEYAVNHAFSFAGLKKSNLKRIIVDNEIYEDFVRKIKSKLTLGYAMGDSIIKSKQTGTQFQEIVSAAISDGAEILTGDGIIYSNELPKNVVLANVSSDMQVYQKKFYGPLLAIVNRKDFPLEKLLKSQPSKGIVTFLGTNISPTELQLPNSYVYAFRSMHKDSKNWEVFSNHPSLEYLLTYLGV